MQSLNGLRGYGMQQGIFSYHKHLYKCSSKEVFQCHLECQMDNDCGGKNLCKKGKCTKTEIEYLRKDFTEYLQSSWQNSRLKCMTFEECPFDMLCSQGFCRLPCSIELLCPVGTFCNKESVCEAHGKLANRKERNGVFSEIIFKTLSELNEMPSFGGKLQNLKSNSRSSDYLNYQIETQNETEKYPK